jgi:hypothetical protein
VEAFEDKVFPSIADAGVEVAAAAKGIFKILMGNEVVAMKSWRGGHYQSTTQNRRLAWVWQGKGKAACAVGPQPLKRPFLLKWPCGAALSRSLLIPSQRDFFSKRFQFSSFFKSLHRIGIT